MKVKELRAILDAVGDENAEVYIDRPEIEGSRFWEGYVYKTFYAAKKYVEPNWLRTASRPCQETASCKKALVIYINQDRGNNG